jgi:radical SAM superfamily enzyme YgiQ (UPF0313 family)
MRILFIYPPNNPHVLTPSNFEPLALEILATLVPGHDVLILDMRYESYASLKQALSHFRPDITGLSCNNTVQVSRSVEVVNFIRAHYPSSLNLVGGHHVTLIPWDFYLPSVDFIFTGWAERSFPEFIDAYGNGRPTDAIAGIITLQNGKPIREMENRFDIQASEIPFPDRNVTRKYWNHYRNEIRYPTALVNTSRGCPFRCTFCSNWKATHGHYLTRPAEDVFYEISQLPRRVSRIFFADDNSFMDTVNAEKLCDLILGSGLKYKYSGYCRSDTIVRHSALLKKWREIGLENLCVGFEGIDEEGLKKVNKATRESTNASAIKVLHEIGVPFRSYFLIDPDFESQQFNRILTYVKEHHLVNPMFTIMTPLPGTDYYNQVRDRIHLSFDYFDNMHAVVPTRMNTREFYLNTIRLFLASYSFPRHIGMRFLKIRNIFTDQKEKNRYLQLMPLMRLVLLRLFGMLLIRKLRNFALENDMR